MSTALEKIAGSGGFRVISGTGQVNGFFESIVVNANAVFTELQINGVSVMTSKGLTGVTISQGVYLPTNPNQQITRIQLASGSVIAYE